MAKAFKFELQDVLDFRNFEKDQAQNELAKSLAVETQINNNLQLIASQFIEVKKACWMMLLILTASTAGMKKPCRA